MKVGTGCDNVISYGMVNFVLRIGVITKLPISTTIISIGIARMTSLVMKYINLRPNELTTANSHQPLIVSKNKTDTEKKINKKRTHSLRLEKITCIINSDC